MVLDELANGLNDAGELLALAIDEDDAATGNFFLRLISILINYFKIPGDSNWIQRKIQFL